jgi:hypothetical protein
MLKLKFLFLLLFAAQTIFSQCENDTTNPQFVNFEPYVTISCDVDLSVVFPQATDNCDTLVDILFYEEVFPGLSLNTYQISRVYRAFDDSGNQTVESQMIYVVDEQGPIFSFTQTGSNNYLEFDCTDSVIVPIPTITDNCGEVLESSYIDIEDPNSTNCSRHFTRVWTAIDMNQNSNTYVQEVFIVDNEPPLIFGQIYLEIVDTNLNQNFIEVIDYCNNFTITYQDVLISGNNIIRTYTATDACGNSSTFEQVINVIITDPCGGLYSDNDPPLFYTESFLNFNYECGTQIDTVQPLAFDNVDETLNYSFSDSIISNNTCDYNIQRTWTVSDNCGNFSNLTQNITISDTTPPTITDCPSELNIACGEILPSGYEFLITDQCDTNLTVIYEEFILGDTISDCEISTPSYESGGNCDVWINNQPVNWAMQLFNMPQSHRYFKLENGNFNTTDNGLEITGTLVNSLDSENGFELNVQFEGGYDWSEWSTMSYPTSFKADCNGQDQNHDQWLYYILQYNPQAELIGFGDYEGSTINLVHAPSNNYFGFQYGEGANNFNSETSFGGWFTYSGIFNNDDQIQSIYGSGDFAFDVNCCQEYSVYRQWTAIDCSGNSSTCVQVINFINPDEQDDDDDDDDNDDDNEDSDDDNDDDDDGGLVAICHELGNGNYITIWVNQSAVQAHLNHGDYLGECLESESESDNHDDESENSQTIENQISFNYLTNQISTNSNSNSSTTQFEIYDINGRKIFDKSLPKTDYNSRLVFDFDFTIVSSGVYFYRQVQNKEIKTGCFLVSNNN